MIKVDLEGLRAALHRLPKNRAKTAELGWDDIAREALCYLNSTAAAMNPPKRQAAPWKVEQELRAIADCTRTLRHKLDTISNEAVNVIETGAYTDMAVGADPFAWFPIGRYSFDSDGVPTPEEPWFDHDYTRPGELGRLADLLDSVSNSVGAMKSAPNGNRAPSQARVAMVAAKDRLINTLHWELHSAIDRPKSHILPIAQAIHTWATGEPVGIEWGQAEIERTDARIAAIRT